MLPPSRQRNGNIGRRGLAISLCKCGTLIVKKRARCEVTEPERLCVLLDQHLIPERHAMSETCPLAPSLTVDVTILR